ncbi:hypothetical protein CI109_106701 [Kwoniella shandongensis]|uniref:Opine dehydrogenase domain-containing protein n=1 Tax=Kwoniella shandongensis TaxID=1734106 RepID=A0A5M6BW91_9TREE|nr:uncharacterized protein CI109_006439 [Kwoniella shandongensis]KAA5525269.1 hypothetical protein CI109_006439 [Kwoniella shandongensis]
MSQPKVIIIGTGGIGRAYAAFLASEVRFKPVLFSPSGKGLKTSCVIKSTGYLTATLEIEVETSWEGAIKDAEIIIIATAANGYKTTFDNLAPYLFEGQTVLISAQLSFASIYLRLILGSKGSKIFIGAWPTTPLTGKARDGTSVHIGSRRNEVDVAALDPGHQAVILQKSQALFGSHFNLLPRMVAIELSNLNPEIHAANMALNFTRAEWGEDWSNYGCQTRGVISIVKRTSAERLAVAKSVGQYVQSAEEHYHKSFGLSYNDLCIMAEQLAQKRPELRGPTTTRTRFLYEDLPYGIHPLIAFAKSRGVPTPHFNALALLLSAACGEDFKSQNELVSALKMDTWTEEMADGDLRPILEMYGVL